MRQITRAALLACSFLLLSAFAKQAAPPGAFGQPTEERIAQESLPQSHAQLWDTLIKTKIHVDEKKGLYSATYPPEVKALDGKMVTITGFMLPVETTVKFKHFILAKRTPTCPYCPPGEPNEIIDIWLDKNTEYTENLLTITGTFGFMNNQQFGMFFKLTNGKLQ